MKRTKLKKTYKRRLDPGYKEACAEARKRDKHCRMPGCKAKRVQVHHILPYSKYPSLRTRLGNLICLCKKHHKQVTGREEIYAMLFHRILNPSE